MPRKEQINRPIPFVAQNKAQTPISLRRKEKTPIIMPFVERSNVAQSESGISEAAGRSGWGRWNFRPYTFPGKMPFKGLRSHSSEEGVRAFIPPSPNKRIPPANYQRSIKCRRFLPFSCPERGSNPHVFKGHWILSPARLPIPPSGQVSNYLLGLQRY